MRYSYSYHQAEWQTSLPQWSPLSVCQEPLIRFTQWGHKPGTRRVRGSCVAAMWHMKSGHAAMRENVNELLIIHYSFLKYWHYFEDAQNICGPDAHYKCKTPP